MKKIIALLFAAVLCTCTAGFAQAATTPPVSGPAFPVLTVQPGAHVTFAVAANGSAPLAYQWQKKNADGSYASIAGATAVTYIIAAVVVTDSGLYRCLVSNTLGGVASQDASLTVGNVPVITGTNATSP